jgi:hypothetical protein
MNMSGITVLTVLALICGFLVHSLTQLITARRNSVEITVQQYFVGHWPETLLAAICSTVLFLGMPELATYFPDFAKSIGASGQQTVLSSFAAGFFGNWLSNFLGARARSIAGVSE